MNMEEYEKFHLNKSNVIMLIITFILLVILIVVSVMLAISLKSENQGLPKLNITSGRYTTRETTLPTVTTTETTTKKVITDSPYYEVNVDELFKDDIYTKRDGLTREEALNIGSKMFDYINSLYDITDYSVFELDSIKNNVKPGEQDLIAKDNIEYGELYNFDKILDKLFIKQVRNNVYNIKYDNKGIIIKENDKYYRALNFIGESPIVIVDKELLDYTAYQITLRVKYYNRNYKELGYTAPNYTSTNFVLKYEDRWKVSQYIYPLYK